MMKVKAGGMLLVQWRIQSQIHFSGRIQKYH